MKTIKEVEKCVIIGSVNSSTKDMELLRNDLKRAYPMAIIHTPMDDQNGSLYAIQRKFIEKIAEADIVFVVPKALKDKSGYWTPINLVIGESTSYELAIANYLNKFVCFVNLHLLRKPHDGGLPIF